LKIFFLFLGVSFPMMFSMGIVSNFVPLILCRVNQHPQFVPSPL
jgi:hypothetical protein